MRLTLGVAALLAMVVRSGAEAQTAPAHLRVAVNIQETFTKGAISSVFRSALRGLGDVDIVTRSENPDFVLEAVFMCVEDGTNCRSNAGAIHVYTPFQKTGLQDIAYVAGATIPDSVAKKMAAYLEAYEYPRKLLTVIWGAEKYEEAARRFIGQIDTQCLERVRRYRRVSLLPIADQQAAMADIDRTPNEC